MKASLRSLSKPVHALLSCTNSIKHAFASLFWVKPSPHTQHFTLTYSQTHTHAPTHIHTQNAQADSPATFVLTLKSLQRDIHTQVPYHTTPLPILPIVQCSPFQPGLHSHFPSLQVPCSLQRGWHALWSHPEPIQPSSQRQLPDTQTPWPPQSAAQISVGDRDIEKDKKEREGNRQKGKGVGVGMT